MAFLWEFYLQFPQDFHLGFLRRFTWDFSRSFINRIYSKVLPMMPLECFQDIKLELLQVFNLELL